MVKRHARYRTWGSGGQHRYVGGGVNHRCDPHTVAPHPEKSLNRDELS